MKTIRIIARLLASAPILSLPVYLYGVVKVQSLLPEAEASFPEISHWLFIVVLSVLISVVGLALGASAHAIIAARTQVYPRHAWWLILFASAITLFYPPVGTVLGLVLLVLLFTLQTFKKMKEVEQTSGGDVETTHAPQNFRSAKIT